MHARQIQHLTENNTDALTSWRIAQATGYQCLHLKQVLQPNRVQ